MSSTIVTTIYGQMQGVDMGEYVEFRSVPFAKPPVGELRFKAPIKPEPWEGVLDATQYANKAYQESREQGEPWGKDFYADHSFDRVPSEDCLYLNLWVPKSALENPAEKCPIAMWIHGGAFMGGYATESEFDGAAYCKRGVILASVEYRLNIFGFFAHPWLTAEDGKTSGSYGSLDQIAALEWLYDNADCFGGDKENITVFGQSAGAMSTQTLISSDLTRGKIAKCILQSGGSYGQGLHRTMPLSEQERFGKMFTDMHGIESLEQLRAMTTEEIAAAMGSWMGKVFPEFGGLFLIPCMDGSLMKDGYYELMDRGEIHDIPYMLGATKDDIDVQAENRTDDKMTFLYQGSIDFSRKLAELGRKPAYVYYFTRELPGDGWGAYHSSELFYMFGTLDRCWRPWEDRDYKLSERMIDYWCNFMKTGDPNGEGLAEWKTCEGEEDVMVLS